MRTRQRTINISKNGLQLRLPDKRQYQKPGPYTTARHEFTGEASVMLDANENAIGSPVTLDIGELHELLNRYPDPLQIKFKKRISEIKGVPVENIFAGNGSDEAIDVLMRIFLRTRHR
ncbi:hypothetical protein LWM68_16755 [Niabella sp. W65]|nr:hypothetical protein [Niabella sp. W65]MCH7364259.1 hypothetical protein [Niabella sp. W65]ULT40127.1 hypothetical protein KRR40_35600 [Niabella sp. I65]